MSSITWRKSATKDVRPFFGTATLESSVDLAEIRLYEDGPFMTDTAHAVEPSEAQPLEVAIRPNLVLPADTPVAKDDLVLAVTAVQPFMKKTIGDTTYIVESDVSTDARETVYEKLKKLILQDPDRHNLLKAS